jgi:general secretion pathway protein J
MTARWLRNHAGVAGFTLLETLIATALMAAVIAALATVTAQWLPNWNRGFARVQRTELLALGIERVVADVAAAEFIAPNRLTQNPLFEGGALSMTFVRTAIGPNTRPGLEIVRIAEIADERGPVLVRMRAPFAPIAPQGVQPTFTDPVVLMRAPYRVLFSYAGGDRVWKDTWVNAPSLPTAVRMRVRDAATDLTLSVSTATMLHVELVADCARPSSGANCGRPGAQPDAPPPAPAPQPARPARTR